MSAPAPEVIDARITKLLDRGNMHRKELAMALALDDKLVQEALMRLLDRDLVRIGTHGWFLKDAKK